MNNNNIWLVSSILLAFLIISCKKDQPKGIQKEDFDKFSSFFGPKDIENDTLKISCEFEHSKGESMRIPRSLLCKVLDTTSYSIQMKGQSVTPLFYAMSKLSLSKDHIGFIVNSQIDEMNQCTKLYVFSLLANKVVQEISLAEINTLEEDSRREVQSRFYLDSTSSFPRLAVNTYHLDNGMVTDIHKEKEVIKSYIWEDKSYKVFLENDSTLLSLFHNLEKDSISRDSVSISMSDSLSQ